MILTKSSIYSTLDVVLGVAAVVCVSGIIFVSVAALILASDQELSIIKLEHNLVIQ